MKNCKTLILLIPLLLVAMAGCDKSNANKAPTNADAKPTQSQRGNRYKLYEQEEQIEDPSSPLGYWEVNKTYPVVADSVANATAVNQHIKDLVDSYSCDGPGDESFVSHNVYVDDHLLSMSYDAMWMCSSMPSPDSTSGILNIRLEDISPVDLQQEFTSAAAYKKFVNEAVVKMNSTLPNDCPSASGIGSLFIDGSHIAITSPEQPHGDARCEVIVRFNRSHVAQKLTQYSVLAPSKS